MRGAFYPSDLFAHQAFGDVEDGVAHAVVGEALDHLPRDVIDQGVTGREFLRRTGLQRPTLLGGQQGLEGQCEN